MCDLSVILSESLPAGSSRRPSGEDRVHAPGSGQFLCPWWPSTRVDLQVQPRLGDGGTDQEERPGRPAGQAAARLGIREKPDSTF